MTPPDTNLKTQKRRHRGPLIGMALAAAVGIGVILFWIFEEAFYAPGPRDTTDEASPSEIREGDVEVPGAPDETVAPGDTDVEVEQ